MQIAHLESTDARGVDVESLVAAREASAYRENEALTRQREAEAQRDEAMAVAKGFMEDAEEYQAQMEKLRKDTEKMHEGIREKIKEVEVSVTQDCAGVLVLARQREEQIAELTRQLNDAHEEARAKDACIADLHRELDEVRAAAKRDVAAAEERASEAAQDLKRMMDTTLNDNVEQTLVMRAADAAANALQTELRAAQAAQTLHLKQIHALKCEGELRAKQAKESAAALAKALAERDEMKNKLEAAQKRWGW